MIITDFFFGVFEPSLCGSIIFHENRKNNVRARCCFVVPISFHAQMLRKCFYKHRENIAFIFCLILFLPSMFHRPLVLGVCFWSVVCFFFHELFGQHFLSSFENRPFVWPEKQTYRTFNEHNQVFRLVDRTCACLFYAIESNIYKGEISYVNVIAQWNITFQNFARK